MIRFLFLGVTVVTLAALPILADDAPAPKPSPAPQNVDAKAPPEKKPQATPPENAKGPEAVVVSVKGTAQKRRGDVKDSKWEPVKKGDTLGVMMLVRTGLGSQLVLKFADRGEMTIRSATKAGIAEFAQAGEHVKAKVGVKYGSLRVKVDSSKGTNDFKVALPTATLSIRGSAASVGSFEAGAGFNQTQGSAMVAFLNGLEQLLAAGEQSGNTKGLARDLAEQILAIGKADRVGLSLAERRIAERLILGGNTLGGSGQNNNLGPKLTNFIQTRWATHGVVWRGSGNWIQTSSLGGTWTGSGQWVNSSGRGAASWTCSSGQWRTSTIEGGPGSDELGGPWSGVLTGQGTYTGGSGSGTWRGVFHGSGTGSENPEMQDRGTWQGNGTGLVDRTPSGGKIVVDPPE